MRRRLVAALGAVAFSLGLAQDITPRDPVFERWARDTFFGGYRTANAAQRWDIPASANPGHGDVPVVLKTARVGTPIDLGEALRQYEIDEPFLLVVGFWEPAGDGKRFVQIAAPLVSAEQWRKLWGSVTYADLQRLDALIKDTGPTVEEIRRRVLQVKNAPPFTDAVIQLNPRIDERGQRRLLCSIRFADVFKFLAPDADPKPREHPSLFGVEYPGPTTSSPRGTAPP